MVFVEAQFVEKRLNQLEVTRALLLQMAVSSLFSKKGANHFAKYIKQLSE
jgi:hypothetical protein